MLTELSGSLLESLADASLRSLALLLLALMAWRCRGAALRHALVTAAVCGMLLLPLATAFLPEVRLPLLPRQPAAHQSTSAAEVPPVVAASAPLPAAETPTPWWPLVLAGAYLALALGLGARLAAGAFLIWRTVSRSAVILDQRVLDRALGCDVREATAAKVPLTVGSTILLPSSWREWDDAKLRAVLAHEAAHVFRHDWTFCLLAALNRCLFWFHPLAWWLESSTAALAEQAADDAGLIHTGDRRGYARVLLDMARQAGSGRLAWQSLAMARPARISSRIDAVLDERRQPHPGLHPRAVLGVFLAGAVLVSGLAAARVVAQEQPAPAQPQAPLRQQPSAQPGRSLETTIAWDASGVPQSVRIQLPAYVLSGGPKPGRATGAVRFRATFGPDGTVKDLFLVNGHPLLVPTAREAAKRERLPARSAGQGTGNLVLPVTVVFGEAATVEAPAAAPQGGAATEPLRGAVEASVLQRVEPVYPPLALQARIQGTVRVRAEVGLDGVPIEVRQVSGHPLLTPAAIDAVKQWRFQPAVLHGKPVKAEYTLDVPFHLPADASGSPARPSAASPAGRAVPEAGAVTALPRGDGAVLRRFPPSYPPLARAARVQGTVRMRVAVDPDGVPVQVYLASGHPLLVEAARESLLQWRFRPALIDGKPAAVEHMVDVTFTLPQSDDPPRARVQGTIQQAKPLFAPLPSIQDVPPPRPEGPQTVRVRITVAEDGSVRRAEVLSGDSRLRQAVLEAVKKWRYVPALLDGRAVEAELESDIRF